MTFRKALLAATMLALPLAAQAQPVTGFYIGAGAGVNLLQESDVAIKGPAATGLTSPQRSGSVEFNYGYVGVLSLGYGYGNGLRAELEGSYRENEVDGASGFRVLGTPLRSDGKARSYGVMANVFYDFDLGAGSFIQPYVGAGLGFQWHEYSGVRARNTAGTGFTIDGDQGRFAYQAIVGAAFPVNANLSITAEYRFMATQPAEIDVRSSAGARGTADVDNMNHSLLIGLRYAFGAAPAPAPVVAPTPAAAPAPARTFLVFFDFDRADLTDRARQIIGEAATNSRTGTTRIEVSGHADRSGTPQYNQRLSERRAAAVAAELERRGVARSAMTIQAFGESRPLVPTADGVREPQNRRVEIVLR
ncbi:OmpA family protein [Falsiroseomonas stagni]|uniref:Outer membrane protein OmpA n=1 Tax=Falsiroseomonas stagni DSM 19981 TaxID=1123062 RepID=A0A1I4DIG0_9PROT|nr:OmpA family protein [Falsiroseomonas stagni]SFK93418.1 Outer membrane protein OmpA [Falsiroseomonas stagni DSM 19981]